MGAGVTRERGIALLDRAAEIGLLHAHAIGGGCYGIHPALPWYFRALFARHFTEEGGDARGAQGAFVETMGDFGTVHYDLCLRGHVQILSLIAAEEDNLLTALRLGRAHGWWYPVMGIMQGLRILYLETARRLAWRQLVSDLVPDFIDPASDEPLVGREHYWSLVTEYRVRLAVEERNWVEGERLQRLCVDWHRQRANVASGGSDKSRHHAIRGLPISLQSLGDIQREQGDPTCATTFREALDLATANGDAAVQANCAFQLGNVFIGLAELRNLDEAERWYRMCHDLVIPDSRFVRGRCVGNLGSIALERFRDARTAKRPAEELASHLAEAARLYKQALDVLPATAVSEHGIVHSALGIIYNDAGDIDRAHHHYRQSIQCADKTGDIFHAGQSRYEFAFALACKSHD